MKLYPIFLQLAGRTCLVVGGGSAAVAKARLLAQAGARVALAAETPGAEAERLLRDGAADRVAMPASAREVAGHALVYAASGDPALDRRVVAWARAAGIPASIVDGPDESDFQTPAIVDRDSVVIAISTGGAAPVLARWLRAAIERAVPEGVGRLGRLMRDFRDTVRRRWPDYNDRRRFWEGYLDSPAADVALRGDHAAAQRAAIAHINRAIEGGEPLGRVTLVGAGPGAADLLTLRAVRALQAADVIVHDRLIGPDVLGHARRDADRIPAGKAKGRPSMSQDAINELLLKLAREGRRVVRLKGGDPFVFGRGGEEQEFLRRHDVAVDVVPGITAAAGCAASVGLPLTHRDHADGVVMVSGHEADGKAEADWAQLARSGKTLVVYMGASKAAAIADRLAAHGLEAETPVAVIENGTLPGQRVLAGSLWQLPDIVTDGGVGSPALIVIGAVARLAQNAERPAEALHAALAV
jgi:uroporphyrin-III C-methyltransferase/precorrin-2 dehydrogenase/sirohydrochlorin ferrochelatase